MALSTSHSLAVDPAPASHVGSVESTPEAVAFPDGIPGFETCRRFVLLSSDALAPLQRIDSVDGPSASFLCVDPRHVVPGYVCRLSQGDEHRLGVTETSRLVWLALVTVEADGAITANLRAPIVINADRMVGRQVLPNESLYPVRHVIATP